MSPNQEPDRPLWTAWFRSRYWSTLYVIVNRT
jgi:hypothetical protein